MFFRWFHAFDYDKWFFQNCPIQPATHHLLLLEVFNGLLSIKIILEDLTKYITHELNLNWMIPSQPSKQTGLDITSHHDTLLAILTPGWSTPGTSAGGGPPQASRCLSPQRGKIHETVMIQDDYDIVHLLIYEMFSPGKGSCTESGPRCAPGAGRGGCSGGGSPGRPRWGAAATPGWSRDIGG